MIIVVLFYFMSFILPGNVLIKLHPLTKKFYFFGLSYNWKNGNPTSQWEKWASPHHPKIHTSYPSKWAKKMAFSTLKKQMEGLFRWRFLRKKPSLKKFESGQKVRCVELFHNNIPEAKNKKKDVAKGFGWLDDVWWLMN